MKNKKIGTDLVDQQSEVLIQEFYRHFAEVKEENLEIDQRVAFEGWVIQKIASMQIAITMLWEKKP